MFFRHLVLTVAVCLIVSRGGVTAEEVETGQVDTILELAGFQGGLIVQLGCGDGQTTEELAKQGNCLLHGLDTDRAKVETARSHLQTLGLYGQVSIDTFDGRHLPYADNLVNLIVAEPLGDVSQGEAMRVLAPLGVLCVKKNGVWTKSIKPRPENIDRPLQNPHFPGQSGLIGFFHLRCQARPKQRQMVCKWYLQLPMLMSKLQPILVVTA